MANEGSRTDSNIFVGRFANLPNIDQIWNLWTPYSSPKHFKRIKTNSEIIQSKIFAYLSILEIQHFQEFEKRDLELSETLLYFVYFILIVGSFCLYLDDQIFAISKHHLNNQRWMVDS